MIFRGMLAIDGDFLREAVGIDADYDEVFVETVPLEGDRIGLKITSTIPNIRVAGGVIKLTKATPYLIEHVTISKEDEE